MTENLSKQSAIKSAQLRELFSASRLSVTTGVTLAAILSFIQREVIATTTVASWFFLIVLIALMRLFLTRAYERADINDNGTVQMWLNNYRLGVLANSVTWGAGGILLFSAENLQHQMFLIFMMAGLSAGSIVAFSADLVSSALFCSTILLPLTVRLFITGESVSVAMSLAALLYLNFMIISSRHINRTFTDNIRLRLDALSREDAVKTSEERYRHLLNHSPVGIFHYNTNLKLTYCNEQLANIFHSSLEKLVGLNLGSLKDKNILKTLNIALQGKTEQYAGEYLATFSDVNFWIDMTCAPYRDLDGNIVGGIAIVRDITESRQKDEMLRISAIAFETQTAMIVTNPNFIILRANSAFSKLTGYSTEEVIGKTPRMLRSGRHGKEFFKSIIHILNESGHWQGEIWNRRKNGMIDAEWLTISAVNNPEGDVSHYVIAFSDITENKDAVAEIHRLAYYDPLTHLPNRRLLQDRLEQELAASIRNGMHGAILFLDLDNFKALNDTRGHDAGDQLLIEVARRLRAEVNEGDIVGRLGGDEFVVLLENLSVEADEAAILAKQSAEKLLHALARPYYFDDYEFYCSTSIGIRLFREQETVEKLLRHADLAMYQAKTSGRNTLCFFDPTMQTMVTARVNMEKDLRSALEHNQFKLYYQSQVAESGQIVSAEALIRWQHPERNLILPHEFIQLAEKTSLIHPIGQWVLETACAQLKDWQGNQQTENLQLAVNVSAQQFRHPEFVAQVQKTLDDNEIKPDLLKLELTESLVLENINDTIIKMHKLRDIGVRFSLDDFGTGYSSFSYLTQLPLDQLKIDRSFVRNIGVKSRDAIIVQTIIGMASNLGIEVIAEGVETESQRDFLEQHGCPMWQGYLFSKPVPVEKFEKMVRLNS